MKEAGLRDVDWAYLAGFLDGEGSFFIHWHAFKNRNLIYGYPGVSVSLAENRRGG
jgi:hypothetical protein